MFEASTGLSVTDASQQSLMRAFRDLAAYKTRDQKKPLFLVKLDLFIRKSHKLMSQASTTAA
jgi:hypothetical protein